MSESMMAYLLGPLVMLVVGVAIWIADHYGPKGDRQHPIRWLDTHYVDFMHHKH